MSYNPPELVLDWMRQDLKWKYVWSPSISAYLNIPAKGRVDIPYTERVYKSREGVLINLSAMFDHPLCGVGSLFGPEFDSKGTHSGFNFLVSGHSNNLFAGYVNLPPKTPTGLFVVVICKEYNFKDSIEFYLFNNDTIPHRCISYAYTLALMDEVR